MQSVKQLLSRGRLIALAASFAGLGLFVALDLPIPFLLGPMFGCLAVALMVRRAPMQGANPISNAMRAVLGVAVGASITPEVVGRLPQMALSVALIPAFILIAGAIGYPFFRRVCKLDQPTSYYAAMPGGLQDMLVFGEAAGADVRALSLIHVTRVLVIVSLAPFLLTTLWGMPLDNPIGEPAATIPLVEMALMVVAAVVGWKLGERVGLFGAPILGPLIATAVLSLAGVIHHRPPAEAMLAAQFFIGLGVGIKYAGVTWSELTRVVSAAVGYCGVLAILSLAAVEVVIHLGIAPPVDAFLAFAPGGQAEMAVLALVAGADIAFVVTHHLVRIVLVITGAPIAARVLR